MRNPKNLFYFQCIAAIGLAALLLFGAWYDFVIAVIMYVLMNSIGQGIVYHRLITHRSFVSPRWFLLFGSTVTTLAGLGSGLAWAANHLQHHRFSDSDEDPHSPHNDSKWHIYTHSMSTPVNMRYAAPFLRDNTLVWFHNHYWHIHLAWIITLAIVYPFGLISLYLAPAHLSWIVSCCFNIYCHLYGYRNFETRDHSTNNPWVALPTFGEGWHNNHHKNPGNWTTQVKWWEVDMLSWVIRLVRKNDSK